MNIDESTDITSTAQMLFASGETFDFEVSEDS
jgi:hypothetical protein